MRERNWAEGVEQKGAEETKGGEKKGKKKSTNDMIMGGTVAINLAEIKAFE